MPTAPSDNDTALLKMILNRKIDIYVKRDGILDGKLQKAYSLIQAIYLTAATAGRPINI